MSATIEANTTASTERNVGRVEAVTGVVIEAVFPDKLPEINHAIIIKRPDAARAEETEDIAAEHDEYLTCEVQQHLGDDRVRAVAMDTTDGLARGAEVIDTGAAITVPVGPRRSDGSSTCSASRSTSASRSRTRSNGGRSTATPPRSRS